jgi:hypothetical protein
MLARQPKRRRSAAPRLELTAARGRRRRWRWTIGATAVGSSSTSRGAERLPRAAVDGDAEHGTQQRASRVAYLGRDLDVDARDLSCAWLRDPGLTSA